LGRDASLGQQSFEGAQRREWAKQLDIRMVHIDPYLNHTAAHRGGKWIAPSPQTDAALALAICYVWITEGLYDKEFVMMTILAAMQGWGRPGERQRASLASS
jgi:anaerobic selenocysteine-containing dehydrogenase